MALLGGLIKNGIKLGEYLEPEYSTPYEFQRKVLKKLILKTVETRFGKQYNFKDILTQLKKDDRSYLKTFQSIPIFDYNTIFQNWWCHTLQGEKNICWPDQIKYFALSSGTSEASSKHIPISSEMTKAIQRTSIRQIMTLSKYGLPSRFFETGILMIGGSTHLHKRESYFEGDLSGIQAAELPFWFQHFYKPGKRIARTRDWNEKMEEIVMKAKDWNIGIIVGVPAWIQILLEKIIRHYNVNSIHDIWPNLMIYVHGGVCFEPYKYGMQQLFGKPVQYIETYLASEGFIAYQTRPNQNAMSLVVNNGLFYEFVPFDEDNFLPNGDIKPNAKTLVIDEVVPDKDYAILLTTCSGTWRYLIGDTVRFTCVKKAEIIITGRTKHFLSLCGEHLSVDNMNQAIHKICEYFKIDIKEFTVAGIPHDNLFAHHWYIGTDDTVDASELKMFLDEQLKSSNDDYATERSAALVEIFVDILPSKTFYQYMETHGQIGGQNKFPRVLNKTRLEAWKQYIADHR